MQSTSILDETYILMASTRMPLTEMASRAGVNYHWLTKFHQRKYGNPGVVTVEKLRNFLLQEKKNQAGIE